MVQNFMIKKSGVEKSRVWTVYGQSRVEKLRVEKFMVEKSGVEAWGWKVRGWTVLQPLDWLWLFFSLSRAVQTVPSLTSDIFFKTFLIFRTERIPVIVPLTIENMDRLVDKRSISLLKDAGFVLWEHLYMTSDVFRAFLRTYLPTLIRYFTT